jgi:hypothetical protein
VLEHATLESLLQSLIALYLKGERVNQLFNWVLDSLEKVEEIFNEATSVLGLREDPLLLAIIVKFIEGALEIFGGERALGIGEGNFTYMLK